MEARKRGARSVDEADRGFAAPEGFRMGNFFIYPSVTETIAYDSNIYGLAQEPIADWRFITTPTLTIQSQLPRHAFDMTVFGRFMNFAENTDQKLCQFWRRGTRCSPHRSRAYVLGQCACKARDEERSAITASQAAAEPVPVDQFRASVGLTRDVGRLYGTVSATAEKLDYHSVPAIGGGTLNQDYRDQDLYSAQIRTGYRISPGFDFVAKSGVSSSSTNRKRRVSKTATRPDTKSRPASPSKPIRSCAGVSSAAMGSGTTNGRIWRASQAHC